MSTIAVGRDPASTYSKHVTTRLLDFTSSKSPWTRRLWDVGSFLALEELYEAGIWVDRRVLLQAAVDWQRRELERLLGDDPALGSPAYRRELQEILRTTLTLASDGRRKLRHLVEIARPDYLARWALCVAEVDPPRQEKVARAVTAHLLDSGHSLEGLNRWLRDGRLGLAATDLISEAAELLKQPPRQWEVLVPFRALNHYEELAVHLPNWVGADETEKAIADIGDRSLHHLVGALAYKIEARDSERAVEIVSDLIERLQARARFAANGPVAPLGDAFVVDQRRTIPLQLPARGAKVLSLASEKQLYVVGAGVQLSGEEKRSAVDEALEIASALNHGPLAPALAGGWASKTPWGQGCVS